MQRVRPTFMAGVVLAAMMLCALIAGAQVMQQVPSDSLAVLKIKNLKATSDKLAVLAQQWGLSQAVPQFADPLGSIEEKMHISAGIDTAGDMAVAFTDFEAQAGGANVAANAPDDAIVALIPVSDYKAFLGNFTDAKEAAPGITQATCEEKTIFIANWGKYAALSPSQGLVSKKPTGIKLAGSTGKEMETKDAVFYANMPAIKARLLPKLQANRAKIVTAVDTELARINNPQLTKYNSVLKVIVNRGLDLAESFLTDAQGATYGYNFAPEGISGTFLAEFAPTSYAGKLFTGMKKTDASLLAGLPSTKYLFYGGVVQDPKTAGKVFDDLLGPIIKELQAGGAETEPFVRYVNAVKKSLSVQTGATVGMITPTGALGQDPLFQFIAINNGDAKAIKAAAKEMLDAQQDVTKLFGVNDNEAVKTSYTPNAKTLDGVTFDQFQTQFKINAQTPEEMQASQFMSFLYGPSGITMYTGELDAKHVLTISGAKDELISKAIASGKSGEETLSKLAPVQSVAAQLPKQRIVAAYIPLDAIVTTGIGYAGQLGMPINLQIPPDLPPIGLTIATDANTIRADGFVPSQLVQSLVAAVMQTMMQMHGGPGGGGEAAPGGPGGL